MLDQRLFNDFLHFSQRQYDSLDYDPFHPMLIELQKGMDPEEALWHSTLYMAYYNVGSFQVAFEEGPPCGRPFPEWLARLPVGVQRRNLRGGKVLTHLDSYVRLAHEHGSQRDYLTSGFTGDARADWATLQENVGKSWGNGRWSVFTTSELYQKVNNIPVLPCNLMNDGSSGPRAGLKILFNLEDPTVEELDKLTDQLFVEAGKRLRTSIPYLPTGHYDYAMLESQLCDFQSLFKGRYYVGRDIDRDQERLRKTASALKALGRPEKGLDAVWAARSAVFESRYLGEHNGWSGRTDYALTHYQRYGEVADHKTILETRGCVLF